GAPLTGRVRAEALAVRTRRGARRARLEHGISRDREQEAPDVGAFGVCLIARRTDAVPGVWIETDQYGLAAGGRRLEARGHLAGHPRRDALVVEADREQHRGIRGARANMLVRIHHEQGLESGLALGIAELGLLVRPVLSGEDPERIEDPDRDARRGEQVGT